MNPVVSSEVPNVLARTTPVFEHLEVVEAAERKCLEDAVGNSGAEGWADRAGAFWVGGWGGCKQG